MSMNDITKCYETLGLKPEASLDEVKEAYRDLVKVWHPDRFAHDPKLQLKAQEKLKEINEAYQKIQDFLENLNAYQQATGTNRENTTETNTDTEQASASDKKERDIPPSQPPPKPTPLHQALSSQQAIRPWVRFWARNLDLLLLSIPPGFLFGFLLSIIAPKFLMRIIEGGDYVFAFFVLPFAVLTEAMVIALFGNTPGKAILRTKVTNAEGGKLSFTEALKRSLFIYFYGYALGFPIINLITYAWQHKRLKKTGKATWDSKLGFNVTHTHIGGARIASAALLSIIIITGFGIINVANKQTKIAGSPVKEQQAAINKTDASLQKTKKRGGFDFEITPEDIKEMQKSAFEFEPFMLNLAEQGRFLKMTIQIELAHPGLQTMVAGKMPLLRDAIGTLISSKTVESLTGTEGKAQLKDELLLRINMTIGKDGENTPGLDFRDPYINPDVKGVYFIEFTVL